MRILITLLLATIHFVTPTQAEPLNIVLLYADDWRHDILGCAGHPVLKTPHLDQLAKEGVRFTHNCVTTSICGVSRATLLTGQWMSRHGNKAFQMFQTPWEQTFPALLKQKGYHVGIVGKWHNGKFPSDKYDFSKVYSGRHWYPQPDGSKIHVTKRNEKDALEFLETRPADKPFCLHVSFFATHAEDPSPDQYLPQPDSMKLYADVTIPTPSNATQDSWQRLPDFFTDKNEGRARWALRFDTPEKYQKSMKNYYRLASEVDATCGKILASIENKGLTNKTLIIFTSDNGYFHGEHGLADKWYPHQESIRVPLLIKDPRLEQEKRGTTRSEFTLNADLSPTLLGAAEVSPPATLQGRDLAALYLTNKPTDWREDFFYEHAMLQSPAFIPSSQALVQKDWKYMLWPEHSVEQLFHLAVDPQEEKDLANDPVHKDKLVALRQRFNELKAAAK